MSKEKEILLSVITVVFNGEKYIGSAIDSVVSYRSDLVEYIIVDGASTDRTLEIIKSYGASIAYVSSEPDLGIYDAMNKGIKLANGEYISFLNSDDFYTESALNKVVDALLESAPDFLYADMEIIDEDYATRRYWRAGEFKVKSLSKLWIPPHPTTVVKNTLMVNVGGFDLRYKLAADYDALLKILVSAKKVVYLDSVITKMRLGGVTNKSWLNIIQQNIEIFDSFKRQFGTYPTTQLFYKIYTKLVQFFEAKNK